MSDEERLRQRIEAQIAARRADATSPSRDHAARRAKNPAHDVPAEPSDDTTDDVSATAAVLEPARPWLDAETSRLAARSGIANASNDEDAEAEGAPAHGPRTLDPVRPWQRHATPTRPDEPGEQPPSGPDVERPAETGLRPARPWLSRPPRAERPDAPAEAAAVDPQPVSRQHRGRPEPKPLVLSPDMLTDVDEAEPARRRGLHLRRRQHDDGAPEQSSAAGAIGRAGVEADVVREAARRLEDAERRIAAAEQRLAEADQLGESSRQVEIEIATAERDAEAQRRADAEQRLADAEQRLAVAEQAARAALAAEAGRLAQVERAAATDREEAVAQLELARSAEAERVRVALDERAVEAQRRAFAEQRLAEAERRMAATEEATDTVGLAEAESMAEQARQEEVARRLELEQRLADAEQRLAEAERAAEAARFAEQQRRIAPPRETEPAARAQQVAATPSEAPAAAPPRRPDDTGRHAAVPRVAAEQRKAEVTRDRASEPDAAATAGAEKRKRWHPRRSVVVLIRVAVLLLVVGVVTALLRAFVIGSYFIPSASMEPTLHGCKGCNNDHVLVNKLSYKMHSIHRGDVVVFHRPKGATVSESVLIKRVIGLPGDVLSDRKGVLYINGLALDEPYVNARCHGTTAFPAKPVKVPEGKIFVMGDNRCDSSDSRTFGPIAATSVIGRAFVIIWPLGRVHYI